VKVQTKLTIPARVAPRRSRYRSPYRTAASSTPNTRSAGPPAWRSTWTRSSLA